MIEYPSSALRFSHVSKPTSVLQIKLEAVLQQTEITSGGAAISQQVMKNCFLILQRNKALLCLFFVYHYTICSMAERTCFSLIKKA